MFYKKIIIENNLPSTVSLLILTYNQKSFLVKLLESITNQELHFDEIVISDDGSTDGTIEEIRKVLSSEKIHIVTGPNIGTFENFKRGVSAVTSKYFTVIAADDDLEPGSSEIIQRYCNVMKRNEIVLPVLKAVADRKETTGILILPRFTGIQFLDYAFIEFENLSTGGGVIYNTDFVKHSFVFQVEFQNQLMEDWLIFFLLSRSGAKFIPVDDIYYIYISGENSDRVQLFPDRMELWYLQNLEFIEKFDLEKSIKRTITARFLDNVIRKRLHHRLSVTGFFSIFIFLVISKFQNSTFRFLRTKILFYFRGI